MVSRKPENCKLRAQVSLFDDTAIHTVPTGLSGDPPSGPAIPVVAIF